MFGISNHRLLVIFNLVITSVFISLITFDTNLLYQSDKHIRSKFLSDSVINTTIDRVSKAPMKYILLWTNPKYEPFVNFGIGNGVFINKSCKWTNCYVTYDRNFLGAYTEFEVIAFNGPQIPWHEFHHDMPRERSHHQKYVYANIESYQNYPYTSTFLDNYFNWTWTYKLNSDAVWGYISIRDANKTVIGPRPDMQWLDINEMKPIDDELRERLKYKNLAAAWFCSNCITFSEREHFVKAVQHHLKKYNLNIDVYGACGELQCPKNMMRNCLRMLRRNYYFYFAFENSICDDYVTEKILYALKYDTVPVVYGGANYSRFMPDGSYLDAKELGAKKLAQTMYELINNRFAYERFFRWKKYYSFHAPHESPDTDPYCNFCAMMNNKTLMRKHTTLKDFKTWWMNVNGSVKDLGFITEEQLESANRLLQSDFNKILIPMDNSTL